MGRPTSTPQRPMPDVFVCRGLPVDGALGPSWDVRSDFAERFWLPRVGPTSFLLHRRLAKGLAGRAGIRVTSFELSKSMGLGGGLGSSAPLAKSLQRLAAFGAARWDEGVFWVSREVRPLANPSALPEHLQRAHQTAVNAAWDQSEVARATRTAVGMASGLREAGIDPLGVEEALRIAGYQIDVVDSALAVVEANDRAARLAPVEAARAPIAEVAGR